MKYVVTGPVEVTVVIENWREEFETVNPHAAVEYLDIIQDFMEDQNEDLAEYIDEELEGVITSIKVNVDAWLSKGSYLRELRSVTRIETTRALTEAEKEQVLDFISGQFSDGFGESLEQHSFFSRTVAMTQTEYDEYEDSFVDDTNDSGVDYFIHLWKDKNFKLNFISEEE